MNSDNSEWVKIVGGVAIILIVLIGLYGVLKLLNYIS